MITREPIGFLSYVRSDDQHDGGRITAFRERLEGEVRMQTGRPFAIFQDRNDIAWGQNWEDRIKKSLYDVTFLIPILTPSFFRSPACRLEFETFLLKEKTLGVNRLILPLYYVQCDEFGDEYVQGGNEIVDTLKERNWTDWRQFRFKPFSDEAVAAALATMAGAIKASIRELISIASAATPDPQKDSPLDATPVLPPSKTFVPEDIATPPRQLPDLTAYDVVDATSAGLTTAQSETYYAYTRQFDEVVAADELADQADLMRLYEYLSKYSSEIKKENDTVLLRMLAPYRRRDHTKLAVTILIDNSGSMRGEKITLTAAWCLIIGEWMERLGIPVEFLGFTTRAWKGGQSRELWLANGKPPDPGRLNDLRHLIYKPFSVDLAVAAPNFGVMAREGLLKENIDGEALLWASSRLLAESADKRLLFVFSDGARVYDFDVISEPGKLLGKASQVCNRNRLQRCQALRLGNRIRCFKVLSEWRPGAQRQVLRTSFF